MNAIDAVIGVYLLAQITAGWRRGFAASFLGLLSVVLAVGGALLLCRPAAALVHGYTGAFDSVSAYVQRVFGSTVQQAEWLSTVLKVTGLESALGGSLSTGIRTTADMLARLTVTAACFVALLIILRIGLGALSTVIASPFEHGPVAALNNLLGAALGGVLGLIHVVIGWIIVMPLFTLGVVRTSVIQSSALLQFVGELVGRVAPFVLGRGGA
ncbi:MAG: hypothetical protein HPY55_04940 [Firmicutes bacterium]|nr:hypothetical protein [Bacillota bacterium]